MRSIKYFLLLFSSDVYEIFKKEGVVSVNI